MPYSEAHAQRVIDFIGLLSHTKGEWAGQPFQLLPWQIDDIIKPLFGTLREDGTRQYRICYVEVPKKNGKSELGAAVGLYMLCADGEAAPEVYGAAADREQAGLVYHVAAGMVTNNPVLSKHLAIRDSRKRILNRRNSGFYQVLSSEVHTKHGLNPSAVLFDEIHAQPNDELWRVLTAGTDYARRQQLVFVMTTAGVFNKESIWWRVREKARQVRDGIIDDPSFLPVLYIADPDEDDPHDRKLWARVNPSLGRIFTMDKIERDYEQARNDLVEFEDFKRFRLNIPAKQVRRWMPMDAWDKCGDSVASLEGRPCYGGIDLASTTDLAAFALVFPPDEDDTWDVLVRAYCPEDSIRERSHKDKVNYDKWVQLGHITATPGNVTDYEFIKADILKACERFNVVDIGYDPWNATQLATDLYNSEGIAMVEVRQGAKTLSEPAKHILKTVLSGRLRHGGNPVLRWCTDNLVMVPDPNENLRPAKDKSTDRIDAFVAMLISWSRTITSDGQYGSVYDGQGLTVIE